MSFSPLMALALALAASLGGNAVLGLAWMHQRDAAVRQKTAAEQLASERDAARQSAQACSASVAALQEAAEQRAQQAEAARSAAARQASAHNRRADRVLSAAPAVPGNDCASASQRVNAWLAERRFPDQEGG